MTRAIHRHRGVTLLLACCLGIPGACEPTGSAEAWLAMDPFGQSSWRHFAGVEAWLTLRDDEGAPLSVQVEGSGGERVWVESPLPLSCRDEGGCQADFRLSAQTLEATLSLSATDHCGARAEIARFGPRRAEATRTALLQLAFTDEDLDLSFDDDGDGVTNLFELETCGRLDAPDGPALPTECRADPSHPCCRAASFLHASGGASGGPNDDEALPREGFMASFAGGTHRAADGRTLSVAAFALDETEFTGRQLLRCMAGGACRWSDLDDDLRQRLEEERRLAEPVYGLTPRQAAEACAHFGKRLPRELEFDFAAAADGTGGRLAFPWGNDEDVSCAAERARVAANFGEPGTSCAGAAQAVASYPTSHARRVGGVLADLAGNVPEWTVADEESAGSSERDDLLSPAPPGARALALRGGGWRSPLAILHNDFSTRVDAADFQDAGAWHARLRTLSRSAGFRCAADLPTADLPTAGAALSPLVPPTTCGALP